LFEHEASKSSSKYRRPLFTEAEREEMSASIVASVCQQSAHRVLAELDEAVDRANQDEHFRIDFARGPFTVFGMNQPEIRTSSDSTGSPIFHSPLITLDYREESWEGALLSGSLWDSQDSMGPEALDLESLPLIEGF